MKYLRNILMVAAALLVLAGCQGAQPDQEFLGSADFCLEVNGSETFKYSPKNCQVAFNRNRCEFRVSTDTMSDFYCITLDFVPTAEGQKTVGNVSWTSSSDISSASNVSFSVKKVGSDGRVWLWSRRSKMGAIVQILD